jgi:cation transport ATPase
VSLDQASKHIIAQTIVSEAHARKLRLATPTEIVETAGEGIVGKVEGKWAAVGGSSFVASILGENDYCGGAAPAAVIVAVATEGRSADDLRAGTEKFLRSLRSLGIKRIVLATGDRHEAAETHHERTSN